MARLHIKKLPEDSSEHMRALEGLIFPSRVMEPLKAEHMKPGTLDIAVGWLPEGTDPEKGVHIVDMGNVVETLREAGKEAAADYFAENLKDGHRANALSFPVAHPDFELEKVA
jgi:hypothetical protein